MPLEFQTALPPPPPTRLEFQSKNPPSPSEFQDAACGMVWIFSGITQSSKKVNNKLTHAQILTKLYK